MPHRGPGRNGPPGRLGSPAGGGGADACARPAPNPTDHATFREVAGAALSRRRVLQAGLVAGVAGTFAAACGGGGTAAPGSGGASAPAPSTFGFDAVPPNTQDALVVPPGFSQQVVIRWGDPVVPGAPAFDADAQTAAAQAQQFGFNNDFLALLGVPGGPDRALLVANHAPTPEHIAVGMAAHGIPWSP